MSLDALIALILVAALAAWMAGLLPSHVSQSTLFGSSVQAKAAAISAGMQASAFYAAGLSSHEFEQPTSSLIASDAKVSVEKQKGAPVTTEYAGAQSSYPAPDDPCLQNGALKRSC